MNREIKFRIWNGKMHYELTHMLAPNGKAYPLVRIDSSDLVIHNGADDVIIMQYTGLKDKNGKEIYEGDVLDFGDKMEVCYGFNTGENEGWYLKRLVDGYEYTMHAFTSPYKVIGNIYSNPELIKKE